MFRLPGLPPGVSPKLPTRPRGALMSSGSRMRTPVGNLLKPGVKPIESMLGGALQATPQVWIEFNFPYIGFE